MSGECSTNGMEKSTYMLLVVKSEGKRPLGRPSHKRADNITMDLVEIRWCGMDWIDVPQDRDKYWELVNVVMTFRVP
jgi:hypothetical protein